MEGFNKDLPISDNLNTQHQMQRQMVQNNAFYMLIPEPLRQYYIRFVRDFMWWYDGFVPYFHSQNSGIAPTRIAYTLLHKLADITTGSKLLLDDSGTDTGEKVKYKGEEYIPIDFMEEWAKECSLNTKVTQAVEWSYAGGDSVIKLDNVMGNLMPKVLRKDEYWFSTDFSGRMSDITMYLYDRIHLTKDGQQNQYYVVEQRRFDENNKPQYRVNVKIGTGARPSYKDMDSNAYNVSDVKIDQLPDDVRREFRSAFPKVMIGEWRDLPFKDSLGVYVLKASEKVSNMPALPFGESLLNNNVNELATYDYYKSYFSGDMFLGKGMILIPENMQDDSRFGGNLNQRVYHRIPYTALEDQTPISIQFDLRASDWMTTRNNILQTFAMNFGVNERTILTSIVPASEKPSAQEVTSDENSTTLFVSNKRRLIKPQIDKMFKDILNFYNVQEQYVRVKFSNLGVTNMANTLNMAVLLKQNGLGDTRTLLEMIYTDKTNREIDVIEERLTKEKESKQKAEMEKAETKLFGDRTENELNKGKLNKIPNEEE